MWESTRGAGSPESRPQKVSANVGVSAESTVSRLLCSTAFKFQGYSLALRVVGREVNAPSVQIDK
jgi:hypothetical protein